ncbi:MFS transporter [Rhizosaccharibacter radicis]|uniref:MFS transporter n=1 Tax=Rhizosaccharibacter radicis TaxID=2782605 RepID=A0ABT1VXS8_9PROT|nr:MFS transporter [Acetobacteraceae bacterium KSS12]
MPDISDHDLPAPVLDRDGTKHKRDLAGACAAHAVHDGFTDLLYALLPVWQAEFGLSYAGLALIRVLYYGTMGALQVPGGRLVERISARAALALATLIAAGGYAVTLAPGGLPVLGLGLAIAGIGSSIQHPRASLLVTQAFGDRARGPLGVYNFAGDLGKAVLPALVALLLPLLSWRPVVGLVAALGVIAAGCLFVLIPGGNAAVPASAASARSGSRTDPDAGRGFALLLAIGALDTAPRMGFLLFLPFMIRDAGGGGGAVGTGLALLFVGGALGKGCCGWLGQRIGVIAGVAATETATALLMLASLLLPLPAMLVLLPLLGIVLNGTSSMLYGTVPELAPRGDTGRAFALFYTGVIVTGGAAPVAYGAIADAAGRLAGVGASALTAASIVPLVLALRPALARPRRP